MLNYEVDPSLLQKYVPSRTQLDSFRGKTYVSLVGFLFCHTKLRGRVSIPFHSNFEEINLRFYVRRYDGSEARRGVVFIAEIVPKPVIAKTARWFFGENYVCRRMKHRLDAQAQRKYFEYSWKQAAGWCTLKAQADGQPLFPDTGSLEQFITEHYWGYSAQKQGGTLEYRVEHPPWRIWIASQAAFTGDAANLYGEELASILRRPPDSVFVAEGSPVAVCDGKAVG